jgi:hypothetical protein
MTAVTIAPEHHDLLSDTIVAYLGYGTRTCPQRDIRAVEAITLDGEVLRNTRHVICDVLGFDGEDLPDAAVAMHVRDLHPWLSPDAVAAIVWNYRIGWR